MLLFGRRGCGFDVSPRRLDKLSLIYISLIALPASGKRLLDASSDSVVVEVGQLLSNLWPQLAKNALPLSQTCSLPDEWFNSSGLPEARLLARLPQAVTPVGLTTK